MKRDILISVELKTLMDRLASTDGTIRQKARGSLVALGKPAIPSLSEALMESELDRVRWEAAKALGEIYNYRAIPALVKALEDSDSDVSWLAAEALVKFKKAAWMPLFNALLKRGSDSAALRKGAHHVLWKQKAEGFDDLLKTLIEALDSSLVPALTTMAASNLIIRMKGRS